MLSACDIDRIAQRLVARLSPLAVAVFGSYALGTQRPSSDLDLVVILETTLPPIARRRLALGALRGVFHPVDLHLFTPEEFAREAADYLSFAWVIERQWKVVFAAPGTPYSRLARLSDPAGKPCPVP